MRNAIIIISLLGLTACATTSTQPALHAHSAHFGQAVKANIEAQAIKPTPEQKADTYIPVDATKRATARDNYRKGETPEPRPVTTTD